MNHEDFNRIRRNAQADIVAGCDREGIDSSFEHLLVRAFKHCSVSAVNEMLRKLHYHCIKVYNVDLIMHSVQVLGDKAVEYSSDVDRLYNFKTNYAFMDEDPRINLLGYVKKHLVSVMDVINGNIKDPSERFIIEHFGDVFNYGILLLGLIYEKEGNPKDYLI